MLGERHLRETGSPFHVFTNIVCPDKNPENMVEATETFKLIQQAYDVLSDPQERAFYDKYRESTLRGGVKAKKEDFLDVFQYFTAPRFNGYNDHDDGFYAVYRKVFEKITDEEEPYVDGEDEFPCFGDSQSSYEDVVRPFYRFWEAFCTKLTFEWVDEHEPCKDYGRRGNRYIMKENQKIRDAAKRERNTQIQNLVSFVKKRDRRVKAYIAKLEEEQKGRQKAQNEKREEEKREKLKKMEAYKEPEWMSLAQLEEQLAQLEMEHEQATEEEDPLYCVACDKAFMSSKSFENHVRSKKHRENEALLKHLMAEEEKDQNGCDAAAISNEDGIDDEAQADDSAEERNDHHGENTNIVQDGCVADILGEGHQGDCADGLDSTVEIDDELTPVNEHRPKDRKNKKKQRRTFVAHFSESEAEDAVAHGNLALDSGSADTAAIELEATLKGKSDLQKSENLKAANAEQEAPLESESVADTEAKDNGLVALSKLKGHKAKEAKRKARQEEAKNVNVKVKDNEGNLCATCGTVFSSRNKMFEHLKKTNHAQYLGNTKGSKARR